MDFAKGEILIHAVPADRRNHGASGTRYSRAEVCDQQSPSLRRRRSAAALFEDLALGEIHWRFPQLPWLENSGLHAGGELPITSAVNHCSNLRVSVSVAVLAMAKRAWWITEARRKEVHAVNN